MLDQVERGTDSQTKDTDWLEELMTTYHTSFLIDPWSTLPETNHLKISMVGILSRFLLGPGLFSGAMVVLGRVTFKILKANFSPVFSGAAGNSTCDKATSSLLHRGLLIHTVYRIPIVASKLISDISWKIGCWFRILTIYKIWWFRTYQRNCQNCQKNEPMVRQDGQCWWLSQTS